MDARELLRSQFRFAHQFIEMALDDVSPETAITLGGLKRGGYAVTAFLLATARPADAIRQRTLRDLYQRQLKVFEDPVQAENFLSFGDQAWDPSLPAADLAAWTTVASVILNLDEVLTKE